MFVTHFIRNPPTFALVKRIVASSVLSVFIAVILAPVVILVEFHVHRASIIKELCVQQDVVEAMRTCHGECQLSKRFKVLEHNAEQEFPGDRIESRFEPKVPVVEERPACVEDRSATPYPELIVQPLDRSIPACEPVPWI